MRRPRMMLLALALLLAAALSVLPSGPAQAQGNTQPLVSVHSNSEFFTKGTDTYVEFTVRARAAPGGTVNYPINVTYHTSRTGNAVIDAAVGDYNTITIHNSSGSQILLTISDDAEDDSTAVVTLEFDNGYQVDLDAQSAVATVKHARVWVDRSRWATVSIAPKSNSRFPATNQNREPHFIYYEGADPTVSFHLRAKGANASYPLTINYKATNTKGNYITERETTTGLSAEGVVNLNYTIDDDNVHEAPGSITIELMPGDGYFISQGEGKASMEIRDDDAPRVRFGGTDLSVVEGSSEEYWAVLYMDPVPYKRTTVRVATEHAPAGRWSATEGSDFGTTVTDVIFHPGEPRSHFRLGSSQSVPRLVSNTGEAASGFSTPEAATAFTTGADSEGYPVASVDVRLNDLMGGATSVAIRENSSGNPGALVATLRNPPSLTANALNTFAAPPGTTLAANTTYFLVVNDGFRTSIGTNVRFAITDSNSQTGATGWSIADVSRQWYSSSWNHSSSTLVFTINGIATGGVPIRDDNRPEDYESFYVRIQSDPSYRTTAHDRLRVTIIDDENPPAAPVANADGTYTVPANWPLVPPGLTGDKHGGFARHGGEFRLLFMTSTVRNAQSSDIADYDAHVQAAAAGDTRIQGRPNVVTTHEAIKPYASLFRALGSTASVHARDHIEMDAGNDAYHDVPVYWMNGPRIAAGSSGFWASPSEWEN